MTLLLAIVSANPTLLNYEIKNGAEVNQTINNKTMLDIAIDADIFSPSDNSKEIIKILRNKGGIHYTELKNSTRNNLSPRSLKGIVRGNIKTTGIAGLPRGGTLRRRSRRSRTRKNRR
ncbi:MAG: hypothetical protein EB127_10000 [Alphaproteobacteria bacterium]|nr:hypothetical protein [Alphaproteobacteria bacterium]